MKYWTKKEIEILRKNYGKVFAKNIPIDRSVEAIQTKARRLGLNGTAMKKIIGQLNSTKYKFNQQFWDIPKKPHLKGSR